MAENCLPHIEVTTVAEAATDDDERAVNTDDSIIVTIVVDDVFGWVSIFFDCMCVFLYGITLK